MTAPKAKAPPRSIPSWMITGLISGCAVAYVYFGFLPGQLRIRKTQALLRERQSKVLQSDRLASPIRTAEEQLANIHRIADRWQQNTPPVGELSLVYSHIGEQARLAGVSIRRLEPGLPSRLTTIEQCPLELILEGEFADFATFLQGLERLPTTLWIRNIQFQVQQKGEAGETLRCELSLTVFADISGNAGQVSRPNTSKETPAA